MAILELWLSMHSLLPHSIFSVYQRAVITEVTQKACLWLSRTQLLFNTPWFHIVFSFIHKANINIILTSSIYNTTVYKPTQNCTPYLYSTQKNLSIFSSQFCSRTPLPFNSLLGKLSLLYLSLFTGVVLKGVKESIIYYEVFVWGDKLSKPEIT